MTSLGITGGIGSGKSYVCNLLAGMGAIVYDTDREAKRLMAEHPLIRRELVDLLGDEAYLPDGSVNKPFLASYLFASTDHARRINSIVHPRVREDFRRWLATADSALGLAVLETAILYESGFDREVDHVLMVYAPVQLRVSRTVARDRAIEEAVRSRMAAQMDDETKVLLADFVLTNDGQTPLQPQLDKLLEALHLR